MVLEFGPVQRPIQPDIHVIDGTVCGYYPSSVTLTVNLFTKGNEHTQQNRTVIYENTAESDLCDFVNFINSEESIAWCNAQDIFIRSEGSVQDLSTLTNDTHWEYRARAEFTVAFTQVAVGAAGIQEESSIRPDGTIVPAWHQTDSGGGSSALAAKETGYFEKVEVDYDNDQNQ